MTKDTKRRKLTSREKAIIDMFTATKKQIEAEESECSPKECNCDQPKDILGHFVHRSYCNSLSHPQPPSVSSVMFCTAEMNHKHSARCYPCEPVKSKECKHLSKRGTGTKDFVCTTCNDCDEVIEVTTSPTQPTWEESFDKEFVVGDVVFCNQPNHLKQFIKEELEKAREKGKLEVRQHIANVARSSKPLSSSIYYNTVKKVRQDLLQELEKEVRKYFNKEIKEAEKEDLRMLGKYLIDVRNEAKKALLAILKKAKEGGSE